MKGNQKARAADACPNCAKYREDNGRLIGLLNMSKQKVAMVLQDMDAYFAVTQSQLKTLAPAPAPNGDQKPAEPPVQR